MKTRIALITALLQLVIVLTLMPRADCYPYRQKRVSDQRMAELETLVGLSGLKGKLKTIPYGFGAIDPEKLGRRRRSTPGPGRIIPEEEGLKALFGRQLEIDERNDFGGRQDEGRYGWLWPWQQAVDSEPYRRQFFLYRQPKPY